MADDYVALANITLTTSATSVSFTSISQLYRDLILVSDFRSAAVGASVFVRVNNLSGGSDYAAIGMTGNSSTAAAYSQLTSSIFATNSSFELSPSSGSERGSFIANFMDYSQTNRHKSVIVRASNNTITSLVAARVINTSAISSILISQAQGSNGAFVAGSSFALYGIRV